MTVAVRIADEAVAKAVQRQMENEVRRKRAIGEAVTERILDTLFQEAFTDANKEKNFSVISGSVFKPRPNLALSTFPTHATVDDIPAVSSHLKTK